MKPLGEGMRIALNMLEFNPGGMGGVETYVRELVRGLASPGSDCELTIICSERASEYFTALAPACRQVVFTTRRGSLSRLARGILRSVGIDLVKMAVDNLGVDLVHTPYTNVRSYRFRSPQVVTFLDLQHEYFPEFFSERELQRRRRKFQQAAHIATRIIAISRFTKDCLVELYGVEPGRIHVVHLASNPSYCIRSDQRELAAVRKRYGLIRPFLFYPAATWPHKNHAMLLEALKIIVERHNFSGELVLTGIASHHHETVRRSIAELGLTDQVRILGYLPYDDIPYLYNLARLLVFPSLHEGFGIPLVEAMASGCPVVCSDRTSIPEVVGDAGLMFNPESPEEIAVSIWTAWNNQELLSALREKGLRRAADFSWARTIEDTIHIYRGLCTPGVSR